jgi:deoxyadenosine/deoxycytidine kinase
MKVAIDGNLGSNVTHYLERLKKDGYVVNFEKTTTQSAISVKFHKDMKRYALSYHLQILHNYTMIPHQPHQINLYERSPYSFKQIYEPVCAEMGSIDPDEHQVYLNFSNLSGWQPDAIIYLYCLPETCIQRVQKEQPEITLDYLRKVHLKHEIAFDEHNSTIPIYKVNSHEDPHNVYLCIKDILAKLPQIELKESKHTPN